VEALGINLGYLLVQVFNFLILVVVLRSWVFKPIGGMLSRRRETIHQGLEDARVAAEARANAEKEAQSILAKAQQEAAAAEAEQTKQQALAELRGQIGGLAIAAAQKLIQENLDERRQRALIDEFFSGLKGGKVVLLEGEKVSGMSVEVTTALPLTSEEQEALRRRLSEQVGAQADVRFRVDPEILGGLVVRAGDRVLDGSVAGRLEGMRSSLR
jgi:F0F1-type ATP synthase membrane subunit b/b'